MERTPSKRDARVSDTDLLRMHLEGDPNAFEQFMSSAQTTGKVSLAYAFLKDPGGKKIAAADIRE